MAQVIDVRGLFCPEPVLRLKNAIDAGACDVTVLADDPVAADNVKRLAMNSGYTIEIERKDEDILLRIRK